MKLQSFFAHFLNFFQENFVDIPGENGMIGRSPPGAARRCLPHDGQLPAARRQGNLVAGCQGPDARDGIFHIWRYGKWQLN